MKLEFFFGICLVFLLNSFIGVHSQEESVSLHDSVIDPNETTTATDTTTTILPFTTGSPLITTTVEPAFFGNWSVTNDNGTVCILLKMSAQFQIQYIKVDNTTGTGHLNIPDTAVVDDSSSCSYKNETQFIKLDFNKNSIEMLFKQKNGYTWMSEISLMYTLDEKNFPSAKEPGKMERVGASGINRFKTPVARSYLCKTEDDINLLENDKVVMKVSDLQVEVFRKTNDTAFASEYHCKTDDKVSDIVPIAVGCALAGLVLTVLVAYLVGRRRSRQKGYQSV
ncbi:lysosome-associated membrane glycoprotein 1-like [Limulus polyphemus]|uniref:Lysosome-associated membrane glycoprotein 5 n=1 Tax=Limulus polyphemus TaxID=6850 RepID=A0ABM1T323_LIMPO|nr:lysosome-associated membrane glycoprotein 1-like [Limulus polyphemus]